MRPHKRGDGLILRSVWQPNLADSLKLLAQEKLARFASSDSPTSFAPKPDLNYLRRSEGDFVARKALGIAPHSGDARCRRDPSIAFRTSPTRKYPYARFCCFAHVLLDVPDVAIRSVSIPDRPTTAHPG